MKYTRRGKPQRAFAALTLLIFGLGTMMFGFTSGASAGDTCPNTGSGWVKADNLSGYDYKFEAPANKVIVEICVKGADQFPLYTKTFSPGVAEYTVTSTEAGFTNDNPTPPEPMEISHASMLLADKPFVPDTGEETRTSEGQPDCETDTVPTWTEKRTRTEVSDGVWGEWSAWEKVPGSDSTRPATTQECPPDVLGSEQEMRTIAGEPDCEAGTVPLYNQERTRQEISEGVYGDWSEWTTVSTGSRAATTQECPPDVLGSEQEMRTIPGQPDCEAGTVPVSNQERTRQEISEGVYGDWSEWTTVSTTTRDTTAQECPGEIETLPNESNRPNPGDPGDPGNPGGGEPEVLGIEANAPAAAPTAVDAGLTAAPEGDRSMLWVLAGAAFALAGLVLGFSPAAPRGKRAL